MKLEEYTEHAISLLGGKLPEVVYLPPSVRKKARIAPDGTATKKLPSDSEQVDRIVAADPIGFLVALMNGQPIVTFRVEQTRGEKSKKENDRRKGARREISQALFEEGDVTIFAEYHTPSVADRERIAMFFTSRIATTRTKGKKDAPESPDAAGYEAMIGNANARGKSGT